MSVTRRASTLTPRDVGRTITGTDALTGDTFTGVLTHAHYNEHDDLVCIHFNRYPYVVHPDDKVQVTGAVVEPTPQVVGNLRLERNKT